MAKKITELTELTTIDSSDLFVVEDVSTNTTKKIRFDNMLTVPEATYTTLGDTPDTVTYNGNRSYDLVFNGQDHTDVVSKGMRLKLTRTVTAPTQCTDLESGSSQYYNDTSVSGMTFTDDFVVSAWIKLESHGDLSIASRYNGTSGWKLAINVTGQVVLVGYNAGATNLSYVTSYQSVPLGKWVHIAAQLDMSAFTATTTTSYVMLDGLDVPAFVTRGGTNPTALIQAGNLEVGSDNATRFFDGKIAQVAIYSAKVTQANVRATISQGLSGSETSLISAYSFNNSIADLNTGNANNLTANGSAVATNTDSPFTQDDTNTPSGTIDFGIVTAKVFSTNTTLTIQVPEGCAIPTSGGVSAVSYSSLKAPYGFPSHGQRWVVEYLSKSTLSAAGTTTNTWYTAALANLNVPIGVWKLRYYTTARVTASSQAFLAPQTTLSTSTSSVSDGDMSLYGVALSVAMTDAFDHVTREKFFNVTSATPYYLLIFSANTSISTLTLDGAQTGNTRIVAECAYV